MKVRLLLLILLIPAATLPIYAYSNSVTDTYLPQCGGGYLKAPTEPGVYNGLCVGYGPYIYKRDLTWFYLSLVPAVGLVSAYLILGAGSQKSVGGQSSKAKRVKNRKPL